MNKLDQPFPMDDLFESGQTLDCKSGPMNTLFLAGKPGPIGLVADKHIITDQSDSGGIVSTSIT